jgi:hypothetical protein
VNEDLQQLRKKIDSNDPFMSRGHGIKKPRTDDKKRVPEWALSDKEIQRIVLTSFPKYATDGRQRKSAARWIRVIHLFFRMGWSRGHVAEEMKISYFFVDSTIRAVRRVAQGLRANGEGVRGIVKPIGRPKKVRALVNATIDNEKPNIFCSSAFMPNRTDN